MKTLLVGSAVLVLLCLSSIIFSLVYTAPDNDAAGRVSANQSWVGLTKKVYVIGEWQPYLKTLNNCTNFRNAATRDLFRIWPEPSGEFCCEDGQPASSTIASYVHSARNGRYLHPIPYYDVGIVTDKTPYWTSWRPDRVSQKDITNVVFCEVNDLKKFYVRRYWIEAFLKQGLLFSAVPFILLVELVVLVSGLSKQNLQGFPRFLGSETVWDLVHLCFLGVNGSLLMENVGHSDPCGWEAVLLYNSAVGYTYLTALSVISAMLHQVALWSRAHTNERLRRVEGMDHSLSKKNVMMRRMDRSEKKIVKEIQDPCEKVTVAGAVKRSRVEMDWQLQRMSAQAAVFFVASLYCTFVTVYSRDEFVAWLLGIIILALVWSCSVGLAMLWKAVKLVRACCRQRRAAKAKVRKLTESGVVCPSEPEDILERLSVSRFTRSPTL